MSTLLDIIYDSGFLYYRGIPSGTPPDAILGLIVVPAILGYAWSWFVTMCQKVSLLCSKDNQLSNSELPLRDGRRAKSRANTTPDTRGVSHDKYLTGYLGR